MESWKATRRKGEKMRRQVESRGFRLGRSPTDPEIWVDEVKVKTVGKNPCLMLLGLGGHPNFVPGDGGAFGFESASNFGVKGGRT